MTLTGLSQYCNKSGFKYLLANNVKGLHNNSKHYRVSFLNQPLLPWNCNTITALFLLQATLTTLP